MAAHGLSDLPLEGRASNSRSLSTESALRPGRRGPLRVPPPAHSSPRQGPGGGSLAEGRGLPPRPDSVADPGGTPGHQVHDPFGIRGTSDRGDQSRGMRYRNQVEFSAAFHASESIGWVAPEKESGEPREGLGTTPAKPGFRRESRPASAEMGTDETFQMSQDSIPGSSGRKRNDRCGRRAENRLSLGPLPPD